MKLARLSLTCPATCFVGVFLLALMTTLGCLDDHPGMSTIKTSNPSRFPGP